MKSRFSPNVLKVALLLERFLYGMKQIIPVLRITSREGYT